MVKLSALVHKYGDVFSWRTEYRAPFDSAQDRPFDSAQDRPFDSAQDRPFDSAQGSGSSR
jgi:hypothetical protein